MTYKGTPVQVASVLSTPTLHHIKTDRYFMALAHLVQEDDAYASFFRARADEGAFVLMDNGVVEGDQQTLETLVWCAERINATEIILPDAINNPRKTLEMSSQALKWLRVEGFERRLMAVPQGGTVRQWLDCLRDMRDWPVNAIGISRFVPGPRQAALLAAHNKDLLPAWHDYHLLGCLGDPKEVADITAAFPDLNLRGVDSAYPLYYALEGLALPSEHPVPRKEVDFVHAGADGTLLDVNIYWWKARAGGRL